jgi:hypothetical protein
MTVNRAAGVLTLALLLAGCTGGTTAPAPTPPIAVSVMEGADIPPFPDATGAKYHNSRSLCDAVAAHPVKGFAPTKMSVSPGADSSVLMCILSDDGNHDMTVNATVGDGPTASFEFDHDTLGGSPVSGIGDKAMLSADGGILTVLKGTNLYTVSARVDGDHVAIENEIALAVV